MAATKPKAAAPSAGPTIVVQDIDDSTLRKVGEEQPSPLIPHVKEAEARYGVEGAKALGVGVTEDYPHTTIYTHLRKAERQLKLQDRGLKIRIWDKRFKPGSKTELAEFPHMAFKVIPIPAKADADTADTATK